MIETLARLGYASKALIYAIVGSLAVAAALNRGGRITDTPGALRVLLTQPLGNTLLWLWRSACAAMHSGVCSMGCSIRIGTA